VTQTGLGDVPGRLLEQRIVLLGTRIDDAAANAVVAQLISLEADDPERAVQLYVNSPGGSAYGALAIYDAVQALRCDVATICMGSALETAAVVLAGGTRGKRSALPNAKILIKQPTVAVEGPAIDVEAQARETGALRRRMEELISQHTGQPIERVRSDMERDTFMDAREAVEYGIIDEVIARRPNAG
jgi:ATP-dependent Clp protease, protease subunit